jgi:hypothetical protein
MSEQREVILCASEKTDTRITLGTYRGIERVDIRIYCDINGERRPTKKGVSVPILLIPRLIESLQTLFDQSEAGPDIKTMNEQIRKAAEI